MGRRDCEQRGAGVRRQRALRRGRAQGRLSIRTRRGPERERAGPRLVRPPDYGPVCAG